MSFPIAVGSDSSTGGSHHKDAGSSGAVLPIETWHSLPTGRIRLLRWGTGRPTCVLLHGGGAHSGWWQDVAAQLAGLSLVAIDLAGHGDSDWRPNYSVAGWAEDVASVMASFGGAFVLIAHSMGGSVATVVSARFPELVGRLIVLDSLIPSEQRPLSVSHRPRVYSSEREAMRRFKFVPEAASVPEHARERIALQSIRRVPGGWTWKLDPAVFTMPDLPIAGELLHAVRVPVTLVHAEQSTITSELLGSHFLRSVGGDAEYLRMRDVGHHLILEAPGRVAALIRERVSVNERRVR